MTVTQEPGTWPDFLTVPEAAAVLRISKMTVYRMIHRGDLESIRVGRSFRITSQSLSRVVREGTLV
jgi:excisionase family DNA binding protein